MQIAKDAGCGSCAELKEELQLMKETLDRVVDEIWRLKQPGEAMPAENKNMHIMVDSSFVVHVFVGFVGVVIGMVVVGLFK